jgi:SAM-dependent methyltransferase
MVYLEFCSLVEGIFGVNQDKREAQKLWNTHPCGTGTYLDGIEPCSLEFFDAIARHRYEVTDTWMKRVIDFGMAKGKRLLEIGHGIGTDLLTFCEGGAEVYGIEITETHHRLTQRNFVLHGKTCVLKVCDGADIDFPAGYFDYVYTHGVLHHTPDTGRCISEAYRVLKPGGQFIVGLYHTYSAYHIFSMIIGNGFIKGKLFKLGYSGLMSTVEYGADGISIKPLVKTYTKRKLRYLLSDFSRVKFKVAHFKREHIPRVGRLMPRRLEKILEPYLGWYVIAFATK